MGETTAAATDDTLDALVALAIDDPTTTNRSVLADYLDDLGRGEEAGAVRSGFGRVLQDDGGRVWVGVRVEVECEYHRRGVSVAYVRPVGWSPDTSWFEDSWTLDGGTIWADGDDDAVGRLAADASDLDRDDRDFRDQSSPRFAWVRVADLFWGCGQEGGRRKVGGVTA